MDVNQTHYHLVSGENDWLPLLADAPGTRLWWEDQSRSVLLAPQILRLPVSEKAAAMGIDQRRGASFDQYGNVYWIDELEKGLRIQPAATPLSVGDFWSVKYLHATETPTPTVRGAFAPCVDPAPGVQPILRGLTVTAHQYLVVGTHSPGGLLVFDLHAGGPPSWLRWPDKVPFAPFDLTPIPDGGVWILDRGATDHPARLWRLDRFFRVVPCSGAYETLDPAHDPLFHPVGETPRTIAARRFPAGIEPTGSSPLAAINPLAIEGLPEGSALILDTPADTSPAVIHWFRNGLPVDHAVLDETVIGTLLPAAHISGHDMAFLPAGQSHGKGIDGTLYIVAANGTQVYQLMLRIADDRIKLTLQSPLLPMRGHSGKALIRSGQQIHYDFGDRWLPLTEQPRRRFRSQGALAGLIKDGKEPGCVWHRLMVDACIPEGTNVMVESRTSNHRELLAGEPWHREPALYLRSEGSEIPLHQPFGEDPPDAGTGTWELLFQQAVGQYIELRLTLQGTGRTTPRIHAVRLYYPRFSYLSQYLPAVYRQDKRSANFLDRFLANVEGLYTSLEGRVERMEALLDSRTAPAGYLEWLSGWLGAVADPCWDDRRRRLFLEHAELLYRWRGTQIGLRAAIRLHIDACPGEEIFDELKNQREYRLGTLGGHHVRIVEQFLVRQMPGITLGDAGEPTRLGLTSDQSPWDPSQGPYGLHLRFQNFLSSRYTAPPPTDGDGIDQVWGVTPDQVNRIEFPPILPECQIRARDWLLFIRDHIGFTYASVSREDAALFQAFLSRRYRRVQALNTAYGKSEHSGFLSFDDVALPTEMPTAVQPLSDWIAFVSLAVPIQRSANRFRVLVPTQLGELPQSRQRRKAQVEEIVKREKPAHTDFDVGLYWALFQIGSARLGLDTSVGEGSRFAALVLGENYLGQGFLAHSHPWCVHERTVVGRDRLNTDHTWRI